MTIPYPDWLPLAQKSDKSPATDTGFRTDQPLVGAPIFQKLTDDLKTSFSLKWIFTFHTAPCLYAVAAQSELSR
ncbi:Uncharacterised protein [Hafnia alvei]|nr:Uncharacterised protein [Hafnia alvei]